MNVMGGQSITVHGSAIVVGRYGILIRGASGSGKSRLADMLIERAQAQAKFARWVSDDQVHLKAVSGTVLAHSPLTIAGLREQRFVGISRGPHEVKALLDVVVDLVAPGELERMPEPESCSLVAETKPLLRIAAPASDLNLAAEIVQSVISGLN